MIDDHVGARARRADADLHALEVLRRLVAVGDALRDRDGERRIAHLHDEVLQLLALRRHGQRVGIGAGRDVARSAHQRLQRLRAAREGRDLDLEPLVGEILALLRDDQRQIRQAERGGRDIDLALLRCRLGGAACGSDGRQRGGEKCDEQLRRVADMGLPPGGACGRLSPSVDTTRRVAKRLFRPCGSETRPDRDRRSPTAPVPLNTRFICGGQPALAGDPGLHGRRIIGHQLVGAGDAGDAQAGGPALVVIGLVEAEARARRHADAVQRHDAEHQRAGRIADAVDDDALACGRAPWRISPCTARRSRRSRA